MAIHDYAELAAGVLDDGDILDGIMDGTDRALPDVRLDPSRSAPDGVRELAFRLWVFEAARNPRRVVELVQERTGLTVSQDAVRGWSRTDDWAGNAGRLHQAFAFVKDSTIRASLDQAGIEAVGTLREIMGNGEASAAARVKAAVSVLGMNGYVPVPSMVGAVSVAVNVGRDELSQATDDQLSDIAAAYQPDTIFDHTPPPEPTEAEYRVASHAHRTTSASRRHPAHPSMP